MPKVKVGLREYNPSGIFADHFAHNVGNNHETYIEYPDMREISLPLTANGNEINKSRRVNMPFQAIFGNWNGKGIFERKECKERQREEKKNRVPRLTQKEIEILKNREYYYGKRR